MAKIDAVHMATLEDVRFVRRLKRLDVAAFERLYDEASPVVYGHLLREASDAEIAETLLVETFYRAWTKIQAFAGDRSMLRGWLIGIADELLKQRAPLHETGGRAA